jgi:hypothetical protein
MPGRDGRLKIVLGAVISLVPFSAGIAWIWMQLAVGLRRLGHEVIYLEELDPSWCVDRGGLPCSPRESANRDIFAATMRRFELQDTAWQIDHRGEPLTGGRARLHRHLAGADLLINMAGHIGAEPVLARAGRRVYVDQDPVYTQLWHAAYGKDIGLERHDVLASVGLNIGTPATAIPACGRRWQPVLPAVVPDLWDAGSPPGARFTTIASWESFGDLAYQGRWYRGKRASFTRLVGLPRRVSGQQFELALRRQHPDDERLARQAGWHTRPAARVAGDLDSYQDYLAGSRGEIGIAKEAYVTARSGWVSDRATHYLAAGRPVIAQATGAQAHLPSGAGLLFFDTCAQAAAAVETVNRGYHRHCRAARELAHDIFGYQAVLPAFLEACLA